MSRAAISATLLLALTVAPVPAQAPPLVEGVEWAPLRDHCRALLKAPLQPETAERLAALLRDEPADPDAAAAAVQKLLDPCCLLVVTINPESRVKAARGPAEREMILDKAVTVLIKVQNDAGSTAALTASGPEIRVAGQSTDGRWLEAAPATEPPFASRLSGRRLEYVVLRLTPREAGKREATFRFDVGQGTQDLGFRAETPILFTVRER